MWLLILAVGFVMGIIATVIFGGYLLTRDIDRRPWQEKYWHDEEQP